MGNNKNNLNKAMFDMFGVGKAPEEEKKVEITPAKEETAAPVVAKPAPVPVRAAPPAQPTYIASCVSIEGTIRAKGDIEMAGELKGDIIAEGAATVHSSVNGNISAETIKLVDCSVTGDLNANGDVVITENSVVNGNINGKSLTCSGRINGDVVISENLSLDSSARVIGKITTGSMIVARGAIIKGTLEMRTND